MFLKRYISIIRKTWNRFGICWLKASGLFRTSIPSRANTSSCETPWNNSFDERFSTRRCSKSRTRFSKSKKTYRRREKKTDDVSFRFSSSPSSWNGFETTSRRLDFPKTRPKRRRKNALKVNRAVNHFEARLLQVQQFQILGYANDAQECRGTQRATSRVKILHDDVELIKIELRKMNLKRNKG